MTLTSAADRSVPAPVGRTNLNFLNPRRPEFSEPEHGQQRLQAEGQAGPMALGEPGGAARVVGREHDMMVGRRGRLVTLDREAAAMGQSGDEADQRVVGRTEAA